MFSSARHQSHSREMENTDSFAASTWASPVGRIAPDFSAGIQKMLAQHLREMEEDGLVIRKDLCDRVLHVEYSLSESRGLAMLRLIEILRNWSKEHLKSATNISKES
jgi:hypothetical protein